MKRLQSTKARITALLGLIVLFFGIVFFLLRGPYLSNSIKRILIPALESVTRESIIIDKAVINLFPFYVQAKGFKLFDRDGNRLLWITKTRAYIDLIGLLSNEIRIRKLTLLNPDLSAGEQDLARLIDNVKQSSDIGKEGKFSVVLRNIKITDGNLTYRDSGRRIGISGSGLFLDMVTKKLSSTINVSLNKSTVTLPNGTELDTALSGRIRIENGSVEILKTSVSASGSTLNMSGNLQISTDHNIQGGTLRGSAKILADTFGRVFDVKTEKEGRVSLDGSVHLIKDENSKTLQYELDLKTDSQFYLETLMEILNVNENIKGKVSFRGTISGVFPNVTGTGTARLENAVFDTLPINELEGEVYYNDRKFALNGFTAHSFNGTIYGDAHILIPDGDYSVEGEMSNIFSPEFFQFIQWKPPLPEGEVNGNFHVVHNHGEKIQVTANLTYGNSSGPDGDVLNRVKTASTSIVLKEDILTLTDAVFSTDRSALTLGGRIDLGQQVMNLDLELASDDVSDLSAPYYTELVAPGRFMGKIAGSTADPVLSGTLALESGTVQGLPFSSMIGDVFYTVSTLSINSLRMEQDQARYDISGSVNFRKSEQLFSFKDPYFNLEAAVTKVPVEPFITAYLEVPVQGIVDGTASFRGDFSDYACTAKMVLTGSSVYGQTIENAEIHARVDPKKIHFNDIRVRQGSSRLSGSATLFFDKTYKMALSSDMLRMDDIAVLSEYPVDAAFSLNISGAGSFEKPAADFSVNVLESSLKGQQAGKGTITGSFESEKLEAEGVLADGRIRVHLQADFPGFETWSLNGDFEEAGYDFLLTGFLKEVPDNFAVRGKGAVEVSSRAGKVSVRSRLSSLNVNLYDYVLENVEDVSVDFKDNEIAVQSFDFRGKNSHFSASGLITPGDRYDLSVKGNIDIAPLQAITDKFVSLDGRAVLEATIKGKWEGPEIIGEVKLENASGVLDAQSQKIGPVNGTFSFRKDRISFESVSVDFAGGTLLMSGMGQISKFSLEKLFLSTTLKNITIRPSEGMSADIGGKLFYEYSARGSALSGDISVKRARYEKKFDWRNWLLGLGQQNGNHTRTPEFLKQTKLNLQIAGTDNIIIDNNIVNAPVIIRLNVVGTIKRYGLVGRVESREGQVFFRGNEFRIVKGSSMDFLDPDRVYPLFHVMADTYKNDYYVRLSIDGGLDNLIVTFFSDPPLPESDIVSLLTLGYTGKDSTKGFGSGMAAGEATALLTGGIQDDIEKELEGFTGLEQIKFEPHTTSTGAFTSKVTVGKRLLEDRVAVTYSTPIGATEEQIIKVEYKLSDEVSVVGSRDEFGIIGTDLKYRLEFK
jgi:translocation and assembly module TamB